MAKEIKYVVVKLLVIDQVGDLLWVGDSFQSESAAEARVAQLREEAGDDLVGVGDDYSGIDFEAWDLEEFRERCPEEYSDWIGAR